MKKYIALLLALVMCLSLCACGEDSGTANSGQAGSTNASDGTEESVDLKRILCCSSFWTYINKDYFTAFNQDGTTTMPDGTWELDGSTVKCTWANGSTEFFEMKCLNGVYYLHGERNTLIHPDADMGKIPVNSVEITLNNWQEYFEFGSASQEKLDQFGEPTGEILTSHYLKLKDEYYRHLLHSDSNVRLRYSINGSQRDSSMDGSFWDHRIEAFYFGIDDVKIGEADVFEMVKIQGTLYFVDGL